MAVPFLLVARSNTLYFVRFNGTRPEKDSLWGMLGKVLGPWIAGSHFVNAASFVVVVVAVAAGAWAVWRLPVEHQARGVALGTAIALIAWMAVNKVWNPQYLLWVFAAGAISSAPARFGVALAAVTLWDWWFEFVLRVPDHVNPYAWIGDISVVARTVVFALMVGWCARELRKLAAVRAPNRAGVQRGTLPRMTGTVGAPPIEPLDLDTGAGLLARSTAWVRAHPGLVVMLIAPFVLFAAPTVAGKAFLDGDNFLQNFPLRALVGRDLAHGTLPLWNPYLYSGTPLLGGFNAGAVYPTTWLMAVLPLPAAWAVNLAVAYDVALLGTYLFLRRLSIGSTAATFGAATFAFAGYMSAQGVHIDLIQGAAWLPWMLLAVHRLTDADQGSAEQGWGTAGRLGWVALLAFASGLLALSGGVEAILDGGLLVVVYWAARFVQSGRLRGTRRRALPPSVLPVVAGLVGGLLLGAAQWLPGIAFQLDSQRSVANYDYFSTGSLPWRLATLVVSPFVLGTNQDQPSYYIGPYNFPEVTSYVGILALIAACTLLLRRWRRRPEARSWRVWYVVLAIGVVSALGAETPFGRLLFLIPFVKDERLLNRNLLLVDFSLAVLLAWWAHLLLVERVERGVRTRVRLRARWRPGGRAEIVATCAPLGAAVLLCVAAWVGGSFVERALGAQFIAPTATRLAVAGLMTGGVAIAASATWVVLHAERFSARGLRRLLGAVLVVDLVTFNLLVTRPPVSLTLARAQGATATAFTHLVGDGRFLIYDPDQFEGSQLRALGQTDLNVFNSLPSGQGYAALTDGDYYDATGAHYQEDFAPASLAGSTWNDLNVTTLLSLPGYFLTPEGSMPSDSSVSFPVVPSVYNGAPAAKTGPVVLPPGRSHLWYFGGPLTLTHWSFAVPVGDPRRARGRPGDGDRLDRVAPDRHGDRHRIAGRRGAGRSAAPRRRGGRRQPRRSIGPGRDPDCHDRPNRSGGARRPSAVRRRRIALGV